MPQRKDHEVQARTAVALTTRRGFHFARSNILWRRTRPGTLNVSKLAAEIKGDVSTFTSAQFALQMIEPSEKLMDIAMKNVNGITATKLIKDQYPEAKIIIVTNFDDDDLRESARQAGACGYVLKDNLFEARRMLQEK